MLLPAKLFAVMKVCSARSFGKSRSMHRALSGHDERLHYMYSLSSCTLDIIDSLSLSLSSYNVNVGGHQPCGTTNTTTILTAGPSTVEIPRQATSSRLLNVRLRRMPYIQSFADVKISRLQQTVNTPFWSLIALTNSCFSLPPHRSQR
jgi:hypothetical protein